MGLDLSLNSTGVAWSHRGDAMSVKPKVRGHPRLQHLVEAVSTAAQGCELVVIESASYASKSSTFHQLAGAWWLMAHEVWRLGIPYVEVAPATLKCYAAGNGGTATDKQVMLETARAAWPTVRFTTDDEADAMWLAAMGSHHLGRPTAAVTPYRVKALATPAWPSRPRPGAHNRAA